MKKILNNIIGFIKESIRMTGIEIGSSIKEKRFPIITFLFLILFFIILYSKLYIPILLIATNYLWNPSLSHTAYYYLLLILLPIFITISYFDSLSIFGSRKQIKYIVSKVDRKTFALGKFISNILYYFIAILIIIIFLALSMHQKNVSHIYLEYNLAMLFFFLSYAFFFINLIMFFSSFGRTSSIVLNLIFILLSLFYHKSIFSFISYISFSPLINIDILYSNGLMLFLYGTVFLIILNIFIEVKEI